MDLEFKAKRAVPHSKLLRDKSSMVATSKFVGSRSPREF